MYINEFLSFLTQQGMTGFKIIKIDISSYKHFKFCCRIVVHYLLEKKKKGINDMRNQNLEDSKNNNS